MTTPDPDLIEVSVGSVVAPAGCGKTQLIVDTLKRYSDSKPILILTHTNAGVAALRERLQKDRVPPTSYRLATIDGWAMKLVSVFPVRSGVDPDVLKLIRPASDYPSIRVSAAKLVRSEHIHDILRASYSRIIVDEYQDCSIPQHAIIVCLSEIIPSCVLGDPMQAIFGFKGNTLVDWNDEVCKRFPIVGELKIPWRWRNAGTEHLGHWLLDAREKLLIGQPIDLRTAPKEVSWVKLDGGETDFEVTLRAARTNAPTKNGSVLIVGDSMRPESRYRIARAVHGASTVEAVDLKDLVVFSGQFDLKSSEALPQLLSFAENVMSNVGGEDLLRRIESIKSGRAKRGTSQAEQAAMFFAKQPSYKRAAVVLEAIGKTPGVQTYRHAVLRACFRALQACESNQALSFREAVLQAREQGRALGRPLPKKAVGSTLLLKGLEAEAVVILNADMLDAKNLYVAMTRGARSLTICSQGQTLSP